MNDIKQLIKGATEPLLLYLINEIPMYGYQIIRELERRTTGYFKLRGGTIYPMLHRLEDKGPQVPRPKVNKKVKLIITNSGIYPP